MSSRDSAYFSNTTTKLTIEAQPTEPHKDGDLLTNLLKSGLEKEKSWTQKTYASNGVWRVNNVTIDSNFDSGNLANVEFNTNPISDEDAIDRRQGRRPTPELEFRCWVAPDMMHTEFENRNKSWFHFRVQAAAAVPSLAGQYIRFNMMNLNKHLKLFNQGMMPVVMINKPGHPLPNIMTEPERWSRVNHVFPHQMNGEFIMSFWHKITHPDHDYYFSFSYPCSLRDQTEYLNQLERRYTNHASIYFHRETLCLSVDKRPVELVTISSKLGLAETEREPNFAHNMPPPLPTPVDEQDNQNRQQNVTSLKFSSKRVYVISSRVHPGETPASHVMRGCLEFLLREGDKRASELREKFIFKIIPIINPDGVVRGHYRTDARGQNLNRHYSNPSPTLQPQCHAYRQMIAHFADAYKTDETGAPNLSVQEQDDVVETTNSGVAFMLDLHAHAAKRGCFLYGNRLKQSRHHAEMLLYARLTSANSAFMDFDACCFSQRNMTLKEKRDENLSKEGSARVAMYYLTGTPHVYTLECNYNTGKFMNSIATGRAVTPPLGTMPNRKYGPDEYAEVGRGLLVASLDLFEMNPLPRVAPNQVKALRAQIYRQVVNQRQNGKVKITSRSTAQHVITSTNERLHAKQRIATGSQSTPSIASRHKSIPKTVRNVPHFLEQGDHHAAPKKTSSVRTSAKSRLPRLKPKQQQATAEQQQPACVPHSNITISFVN